MISALLRVRMQWFLKKLLSGEEMAKALDRIADEIIAEAANLENTILVGIRRRGVPLAEQLQSGIREKSGRSLPLGILDITFYRDDLSLVAQQPVVEESHLPFEMEGKRIILVDDVLFTGRTTRAALESILDYGRPSSVELVVLVDRGHRELPIAPNYVGAEIETSADEMVEVRIPPIDDEEAVYLTSRESIQRANNGSE